MLDPHKGWYSAQELAGLPGMAGTDSAVMRAAKKNLWANRRKLRGKGIEYAFTSLPEETQKYILGLAIKQAPPALPAPASALPAAPADRPAVQAPGDVVVVRGQVRKSAELVTMDDQKREYQSAALILCRALDDAMALTGCSSVKRVCQALAERLVSGEAHEELQDAAFKTYLKPRKGAGPLGGVSAQATRLQRMMGYFEEGRLAGDVGLYLVPGKPEKRGHNPAHVMAFLVFYCVPTRPPVSDVHKKMVPYLSERGIDAPSYATVTRIEKSLPVTVKYRGRMTGSEWRAVKPYIERDVSMFKSNDIWVGDGHSFKAKVQHPLHGQPFVPEVTVIIDWVSRKIVGWSVALAESTVAVSDAFRHAQSLTRARPLVYYSDNGSGQTGKSIDCPVSGTLARQGIAHETGIPGNPQARGIIERLWRVTLIPLAREYPTCTWRGADENATTKMLKLLNRKDQGGVRIPSFKQFLDDVARVVDEYNLQHTHRELGGNTPEAAYQAKLDPDSVVFGPSDTELESLWMPEVVRTPQRGRVSLFNNTYCRADLVDVLPEGAQVRVRYDLHDAHQVWLLTMDGVFLGTADWDSHKEAAFPVPYMEQLRAERAERKTARGERIIAEAVAERGDVLDVLPAESAPVIDVAMQLYGESDAEPVTGATKPTPRSAAVNHLPRRQSPYQDITDIAMYLYGDQIDGDDTPKKAAGE